MDELRIDDRAAFQPHSDLLSVAALLLSVALLVFGTNLQGVLLPIRLELSGGSMANVGLLSSVWSLGFMLACLVTGRVVSAVGHVRSFSALAAVSGSMALLLLPMQGFAEWMLLRCVIGFCFGGLSLIIESWLNERATGSSRGSIFASYMTVNLLASLIGTLSLTALDTRAELPFFLIVVAIVLSIVPVALTRSPTPAPTPPFSIHLAELYKISPSGVSGCFAVGMVNGAIGGLAPAFGLGLGLSPHDTAIMIGVSVLGGAVSYYPAGRLSDHMDRRTLLMILCTCTVVLSVLLLMTARLLLAPSLIVGFGLFGVFAFPLYGLCIACVNDRTHGRPVTETASELLLTYAAGTVLGPVVGGVFMSQGTPLLFLFVSVVLALEVVFLLYRRFFGAPPPGHRPRMQPLAPGWMAVLTPNRREGRSGIPIVQVGSSASRSEVSPLE